MKSSLKKLNVLPENPDHADEKIVGPGRFPKWLHRKLPTGNELWKTKQILKGHHLPTVCEEARCPNLIDCWSKKTATFLAMGKACTRNCGFCSIDFAPKPSPLEDDEPIRLAKTVEQLGLRHVVITMVARDDVEDGGAAHLAKIITTVRAINPTSTVEVLTSDFQGNTSSIQTILDAGPEIFNHNIETVRSLTPRIRHKATYDRTLSILNYASHHGTQMLVKSGFMVGLGETEEEVYETIRDLQEAGCKIITIGQYLQSDPRKLRVKSFVPPSEFEKFAAYGKALGMNMYCNPFVRSSYNAEFVFEKSRST